MSDAARFAVVSSKHLMYENHDREPNGNVKEDVGVLSCAVV
jgi:hypothetical protein